MMQGCLGATVSETRSLHTKPLFYSHWFKLCSCRGSCWDSHFQALRCWCDTAASSPLAWGSPWLRTASGKSNGFPGPQRPSQQSLWARASKSPQHSGGSQVRDWNPPPGTHSVLSLVMNVPILRKIHLFMWLVKKVRSSSQLWPKQKAFAQVSSSVQVRFAPGCSR